MLKLIAILISKMEMLIIGILLFSSFAFNFGLDSKLLRVLNAS